MKLTQRIADLAVAGADRTSEIRAKLEIACIFGVIIWIGVGLSSKLHAQAGPSSEYGYDAVKTEHRFTTLENQGAALVEEVKALRADMRAFLEEQKEKSKSQDWMQNSVYVSMLLTTIPAGSAAIDRLRRRRKKGEENS